LMSSFMKWATGLSLTNAVKTLTGRPRYEATLATLLSALVACILKVSLQWNGWEFTGVNRIPMLVGTTKEYFLSLIVILQK
jgi:hypothetical protein